MKTFYLYDATRLIKTFRAKSFDVAVNALCNVIKPELQRDHVSDDIIALTNEYVTLAICRHRLNHDEHTELFH